MSSSGRSGKDSIARRRQAATYFPVTPPAIKPLRDTYLPAIALGVIALGAVEVVFEGRWMWAAALVAGVVLLAFSGAVVRPGGAAAYRWKVHRLTRDALLEIGAAVDAYQRRDKTARRIAALVPEAALPRPEAGDRMDAEARAIATLDSWDRVTRVANRLAAENASDPTAGELRGLLAERKAQLAGALETQADISRRHVEKLRSVRPPDGYGDTHAEVLRLASEHADATAAYAAAWAAGERERIMRATRHLMDTQTGLIACAERVAAIADAT